MSVQNGRKSDMDKYVHFHLTSVWASFNFVAQMLAAHPVHFPHCSLVNASQEQTPLLEVIITLVCDVMCPISWTPDQTSKQELVVATHHLVSQQPWVPFILSAKTKQSHTKKNPKYSSLFYHSSSVPDHQWSQNIGLDKLYPKTISSEVQVTPSYTKRDFSLEERNEFHREPKVKGKFGFQPGM